MTDTTNQTLSGDGVDPIDEIADLLSGEVGGGADENAADQDDNSTDTDDESDQQTDSGQSTSDDDAPENDEDERSLSELLGLDESQVSVSEESGDLLLTTDVNGVKTSIPFKEVLSGYQTNKSFTEKSQALAKDRREFETVAQSKIKEVHESLTLGTALINQLQQELMAEYQGTNWDELRRIDPAEYAAKQQDQQTRYNKVMGMQNHVKQQQEQLMAQQQATRDSQEQSMLQQQRELMMDNIPEWREPGKMKEGIAEIRDFLADSYGFTEEEIAFVVDARQVNIVRDAIAYRKGKSVADKKVKAPIPKITKPKINAQRKKASKLDRLTKAAKASKGANRKRTEIDAVAELLSS